MTGFAPTAREPRKKDPQYKRQHKAARLRAARKEARALAKAEVGFDKRDARRLSRIESAFKGCSVG